MTVGSTLLGFSQIPRLNIYLIDQLGWRWAYAILGLGVMAVMLPLLAIFYRNRPEDVGQTRDGLLETPDPAEPSVKEWAFTLRQAITTGTFWIMFSINAAWALIATAILFEIVTILEDCGLARSDAATFYTYFAVFMASAQLLGGMLSDRLPLKLLISTSMVGIAASVAMLALGKSEGIVTPFAICLGASQGLLVVVMQTLWARYYGRTHIGSIRGLVWTGGVAGSSLGPLVMGLSRDHLGSFTQALLALAALAAALAVLALFAKPPVQVES